MDITPGTDIIDSRGIIERIEELYAEWDESTGVDHAEYAIPNDGDDWRVGLSDDDADELRDLLNLQDEAEGSPDWHHGETLIHDDYFEEYARQLADDLGMVPDDAGWPTMHIDWEAAANDLKMDYFSVEYAGETYWIRN